MSPCSKNEGGEEKEEEERKEEEEEEAEEEKIKGRIGERVKRKRKLLIWNKIITILFVKTIYYLSICLCLVCLFFDL